MERNREIIESLTGAARTALLGTITRVHVSYGGAVKAELYEYGLINANHLTDLGRSVRTTLLNITLDETLGPDPRDELVAAVLAWDGDGDNRALVDAIITYKRAVKR